MNKKDESEFDKNEDVLDLEFSEYGSSIYETISESEEISHTNKSVSSPALQSVQN